MPVPDFGNVKTEAGLKKLDTYMAENSYVTGFQPTQDDTQLFVKLIGEPNTKTYPFASRWYRHMKHFRPTERASWPKGDGPVGAEKAADDDEDIDLFGDDDTPAPKSDSPKPKKKAEKKADKGGKVDKSSLVIEVKPSSPDTDLDKILSLIRKIQMEGVEWSQAEKKVPLAFGLYKIQIGCTILDAIVNTESILEQIEVVGMDEQAAKERIARRDAGEEEEEDDDEELDPTILVKSAEIVSFNKL